MATFSFLFAIYVILSRKFWVKMLRTLLLIGLGSFLGGVARYGLSSVVQSHTNMLFPWGTFWVNVLGCLAIGLLNGLFARNGWLSTDLRIFLTVGFCGGFTTFSTFIYENHLMLASGRFLAFAAYAGLSLVAGLVAVYAGYALVTRY